MKTLLSLSAATALGLVLAGCSRSDNQPKGPAPVPVLVAQAVEKTMPRQLRAIGNVAPTSKVTIRSQITGLLAAVHFKEGQSVRANDLLFTIDPRPVQAALDQANANLTRDAAQRDNAKIQFARTEKLFKDKVASQDEYDTAKANYDALVGSVAADQAAVSNATLNLEFTAIRSPVDGVVGAQLVYVGNVIKSEDDVLATVNQIHPVQAAFAVPEQYLGEIRKQMQAGKLPVSAEFEGLEGTAPVGELVFVDNAVDPATGTITLKATFDNLDDKLWPGQFIQARLTLAELPGMVVAPSQAVQNGQNGNYVFVVKSDQTVEMRPVKVGETVRGETILREGVKPGETLVTDGHVRLTPGAKVEVKTSLSEPAKAAEPAKPAAK